MCGAGNWHIGFDPGANIQWQAKSLEMQSSGGNPFMFLGGSIADAQIFDPQMAAAPAAVLLEYKLMATADQTYTAAMI